jgi:CubicO group peptidase (beta-lactamase class C family)
MKKIKYIILSFVFLIQGCTLDNNKTINNDSGFVISTPEKEGFDKQLINEIISKIEKGDYGALTSLIVISDNKLIAEHYFNGWEKDSVHSVQSVSKSITSLLIGKAVELGEINSVDEKIINILPELRTEKMNPRKDSLSIEHYLTMSAGFEWSEKYPPMDKRSSLYPIYHQKQDYIQYFFNQPLIHKPGKEFEYNSGLSMTLGAILQSKTSIELEEFAEKYLFKPLDVKYDWHNSVIWENDENGLAHCGGGLYLRPIDMAKIGYMVYNKGAWNGKQIISEKWIAESTSPKIDANNSKKYRNYGYQWWLYDPLFDLDTILYADGLAGQNIFILKEFNTIIVTTGDLAKNATASIALMYDLIATNKKCKTKIMLFHDKVDSEHYPVDQFKSEELVSLAQNLVFYNENKKAIEFLNKYSDSFDNNWYYEFYIGKAYFQNKEFKQSLIHLNKSLQSNPRNVWYLKPYHDNTEEMIAIINKDR